MNVSTQQLLSAINSLPGFDNVVDGDITMLSGGQCNVNVLVGQGANPLVVRFMNCGVIANPIDRKREYHHQCLAAAYQIAPQPLAYYPVEQLFSANDAWLSLSSQFNAVIVAAYCVGKPLAYLNETPLAGLNETPLASPIQRHLASATLTSVTALLATLHRLPYSPVEPEILQTTLFARLTNYWQLFCRQYPQSVELHQGVINKVLNEVCDITPGDCCLIHGDVNPGNIIINDQGVKLIDWEYSDYDDPYIDIASTIVELELSGSRRDDFIKGYSQQCREINEDRLNRFESYYCALCWLWSQLHHNQQQDFALKRAIAARSEYYYDRLLRSIHRTK